MTKKQWLLITAASIGVGACSGDGDSSVTERPLVTAVRFQRTQLPGPITTKVVPRAVDNTPMTVVVTLSGPSVADLQAAAGRKLTLAEKTDVKAARIAEQAAPRAAIEAAGGKVLGSFQSALNGLKVKIPRGQIAALRQIPGVVDVKRVTIYTHENTASVQRIQAPFAWAGVAGVHGEGVKVAVIDTGIDYTHANFGGPGTVDAYNAAKAASAGPADPTLFGPKAPKVKGGIDLVGDAYDAGGSGDALVPHPDPNPLDCAAHGSHVAGTIAGFGVLAGGATFHGPYDQTTHATHNFAIGPGVAPAADLYAVRVFGCQGSTDVIAEALEWAVDNDMDVVNMSLGAAFGAADSADSLASDNAVSAGVTVVSAAGNDGDVRYILSSPGASTKGIAVAATPKFSVIRSANLALPAVTGDDARTINAINANNATFSNTNLPVVVLKDSSGAVSLGCNPTDYVGVAGKIAVVQRGTCARVARAIYGQKAGAAAVVMINNAAGLPPFEGPITSNPDTGEQYTVTIPFFGVKGPASTATSDGALLALRDGATVGVSEGEPTKTGTSSFSSGGPRIGDSSLKPEIAAPGEAIVSTAMGTGTGGVTFSGTSMATPHIAGTAALAIQAHPTWTPAAIKSAIINSGNPDEIGDYLTRRVGSGLVNAASAAGTLAYAYADRDRTVLNFGLQQFKTDRFDQKAVHVKNDSATMMVFDVSVAHQNGSPHEVTVSPQQITVPAHSDVTVDVTIHIPAATAGDSSDFRDVGGVIVFTPTSATSNRGIALKVPYYVVPRVEASVDTKLPKLHGSTPHANATVTNNSSPITATADFYAWGHDSPNANLGRIDLRAAGVQSFDTPDGTILVFAANTYAGWSTPESQEFDVLVDTNGDGNPDWDIFSIDFGALTGGARNGQMVAAYFDLNTFSLGADFFAVAPTDASTILLPVFASSLGVTTTAPRFTYGVQTFDLLSSNTDATTAMAGFNAFTGAVSTGQFAVVDPNTSVAVPVFVNPAEYALTPPLGLMVVTPDNKNGANEADLLKVSF